METRDAGSYPPRWTLVGVVFWGCVLDRQELQEDKMQEKDLAPWEVPPDEAYWQALLQEEDAETGSSSALPSLSPTEVEPPAPLTENALDPPVDSPDPPDLSPGLQDSGRFHRFALGCPPTGRKGREEGQGDHLHS